MTAKEIAQAAGVSTATVYKRAKQLGRLPTVEEVKNSRNGRPEKYKMPEIQGAIAVVEILKGHYYNIMKCFPYSCIGCVDPYIAAIEDAKKFFELVVDEKNFYPDLSNTARMFTTSSIKIVDLREKDFEIIP